MKNATFSITFVVTLIILGCYSSTYAQVLDPKLGPRAWKKENVVQKGKAIELTHIREADVMWATRTWREIDMRQKFNLPLYYPLQDSLHGKKSFTQIIMENYINEENINDPNGVKIYDNSDFDIVLNWDEVKVRTTGEQEVNYIDINTCQGTLKKEAPEWIQRVKPNIVKIRLMEDWFFDKQRSIMDVRILGLGLKFPDFIVKEDNVTCNNGTSTVGFGGWELNPNPDAGQEIWFFYPQLRDDLAVKECYQRHNDAARLSYDDIFVQRIFESYIYREENVYNRSILDYTVGLDALLEAEKIKNDIFEFEQNVWHY